MCESALKKVILFLIFNKQCLIYIKSIAFGVFVNEILFLFLNWGKRRVRMQIKGSGSQYENEDILICFVFVSMGSYLIIIRRIESKGLKRPGKFLT